MRSTKVFLLMVVFCVSCASPAYQIPSINQDDVWSEYLRQNEENIQKLRKQLKEWDAMQERVQRLSYPLLLASGVFCDSDQAMAGFGFSYVSSKDFKDYEPYKRIVFNEVYGITKDFEGMLVVRVMDGSAAQIADIRVGDYIKKVNGKRIKDGKSFQKIIRNGMLYISHGSTGILKDRMALLKEKIPPVNLAIERGDDIFEVIVKPQRISKYHPIIRRSGEVNAYADGQDVFVTIGMLDFVKSDEELQFIIAHEIAHNIERHIEKTKTNTFAGSILGTVVDELVYNKTGYHTGAGFSQAGANIGHYIYKKDFEREADYLSMYILANAQVSIEGLSDFWRRCSEKMGTAIYSKTHPSNPERYVRIVAIDKEIKQKIEAGVKIMPNEKD